MKPRAKEKMNEWIQQGNYIFLFSTRYLSQFFPPTVYDPAGEKSFFDPGAS